MTVLWVSGRGLKIFWRVSGGCLDGVLWVSEWSPKGVCMVSMECLNNIWVIKMYMKDKARLGKSG